MRGIPATLRRGNLGGIAHCRKRKHLELALSCLPGTWNVLEREAAVRVHTFVNRRGMRGDRACQQKHRASRFRRPWTPPRSRSVVTMLADWGFHGGLHCFRYRHARRSAHACLAGIAAETRREMPLVGLATAICRWNGRGVKKSAEPPSWKMTWNEECVMTSR